MQVLVVGTAAQWAAMGTPPQGFFFSETVPAEAGPYDAVLDLLFETDPGVRLQQLAQSGIGTVVVASVVHTHDFLPAHFTRINAWPGFWEGTLVEACAGAGANRDAVAALFAALHKNVEWVPDVPGMISGRVVAAIINEAYFTLEAGTASRQDIDTAMRLGTAYPHGPFAWAQLIGLPQVAGLLRAMAAADDRYQPCALLEKEAAEAVPAP